MAELASGAVTSLLGVISSEWRLLGHVKSDVQFIREEMESMNSFLMHLARTAPPGGEHDEQVQTWMNQVQLFAQDCNNCIELYLNRGNPDIHLSRNLLRRYLRCVPWFLQKMWAKHRAALELSELKERANDIGNRRVRYGVEVPKKATTTGAAPAAAEGIWEAAFVQVDGQEHGSDQVRTTATDGSGRIRRVLFGLYYTLEDNFNHQVAEWIEQVQRQWRQSEWRWSCQGWHDTQCIALVVPSTEDSGVVARQALAVVEKHVSNTILVDIPSLLHHEDELGPKDILYYILREIELRQCAKSQSQQQQQGQGNDWRDIRREKWQVIIKIKEDIITLKVIEKIEEITSYIENAKESYWQLKWYLEVLNGPKKKIVQDEISQETSLGVLLVLLLLMQSMPAIAQYYDNIIKQTAKMLKEHMEQVNRGAPMEHRIIHDVAQYTHILHQVFPPISSASKPQQAQEQDIKQVTGEATSGKNQIKEIVDKVKQEILSEVFMAITDSKSQQQATKTNITITITMNEEGKTDKKQETGVLCGKGPTTEALPEETKGKGQPATGAYMAQRQTWEANVDDKAMEKTEILNDAIQRQLVLNGIVAKIQNHLKQGETLIILKIDETYLSEWEQARNALSLLPCIAVVMILTNTEINKRRAREEYCYPEREPIDYSSLAALYHSIVLEITSRQKNEDNYDPQILRSILDKCDPNELCMKIFAHSLYAKPKRSKEELHRLHNALQVLPPKSYSSIAMKMLMFSYGDMPKDYQSCLLYLAIFPRRHMIRRSTLIGRWVAEGSITTKDWRWSSAVQKAEQCFDVLVTRGLVYSAETGISTTGRVKSCMVGDLVHEFITEIANKQHIVGPRLSNHLAWHFSVSNDIQLRSSDKIDTFLKSSSQSSQWSRLKVLDLEGCKCFMENRRYLKNICNNILLLKYLSLRGTDVNWLPNEINNLGELEVLDIQHTQVPESATRDLLLRKLKRLLAGNRKTSPNSTGNPVLVPEKIEKMLDMEVLSNVKPKSSQDLVVIGKLWQLRKLGVVIEDKVSHLKNLLQAISDLHECIRSLSITLGTTKHKDTPIIHPRILKRSPMVYGNITTEPLIKHPPKILERLSINGNILHDQLLPFLADASTPLIKVTLSNTTLSQANLVVLANLHMLHCLKLRHNTYTDNELTFKKDKFKKLKYFLVEGSNWIEICFEDTAAPDLEKIVLSFDNIESIAGVHHLKKLEEIELNKYNKSSNKSGGNTDTAATNNHDHSTLAAVTVAHDPVPSTPTGIDPAPTAPTGGTANPSPSPLTTYISTSAVANNHVPSTATIIPTTTADAYNPSSSTQTASSNQVLLPKLVSDAKQVSKVTLCGTMLKQGDLRTLARMENIRCLVLLDKSYGESQLDLNKDEFPKLNVLIVSCSTIIEIKFEHGSSPKLEKIVWTFNQRTSLSGIEHLPRLKELDFTGDSLPDQVKEGTDKHKDIIHCTHYKPERQDHTEKSTGKEDGVPSCLYIWKDKGWRRRN